MAQMGKTVDVGDSPDILQLAEEVRRTGEPRILRNGADDLALLTPIVAPPSPGPETSAGHNRGRPSEAEVARSRAGIRAAAGTWNDVDAEALKAYVRERRAASTRPPVDL